MKGESTFQIIKDQVPLEDLLRRAGVKFHGKRCRCFSGTHEDRNPSMAIRNNLFNCYACGFRGDVTDAYQALYGGTALEAAQSLALEYGIDLPKRGFDRAPRAEYEQARRLAVEAVEAKRRNREPLILRLRYLTDLRIRLKARHERSGGQNVTGWQVLDDRLEDEMQCLLGQMITISKATAPEILQAFENLRQGAA